MKLLTLPCLLAACLLATTGVSQEVKKDEIAYDMNHLEKVLGIKFKAAKLEQGKTTGDTLITITLEFTKDLPPDTVKGVATVKQARNSFAGKNAMWVGFGRKEALLKCYFFDEAGVAFTKQPPGKIEGEVTAKKGDAFRITQSVPTAVLAKTKKISFRHEPPPSKEE